MKKIIVGLTLAIASISVALAQVDQAATDKVATATKKTLFAQNIVVKTPELQLLQKGANSAEAFMELDNTGNKSIRLIAASSITAQQVLLHKFVEQDGAKKMKQVNAITIKPHNDAELQPGGFHIMLIGLKQTLHTGDAVPILLIFDDGSSLTVKATVE